MPLRPLILLSLVALLAACSSDKPKPVAPVAPAPKAAIGAQQPLGPLPAYQRELTGTVLGAPAGAEVELALLAVDERGRPQQLLASGKWNSTGKPLGFQLRFNPEAFPTNLRVELRGRASQSGVLILHLPAVPVAQPATQALGNLQLLQAP